MRHAIWLETRVLALLAAAGLVASVAVFLVVTQAGIGQNEALLASHLETQAPVEGPGIPNWKPTAEFRTSSAGIGLTAVSFSVSPGRMAVLFSLDTPAADQSAMPGRIYLLDDRGKEYSGKTDLLGTALGVTAGVLVTETYDGIGGALILAMDGATVSSATGGVDTIPEKWRVSFVENHLRGIPDYTFNGKVAPEVTRFGDVTISKAGGSPGMSYIALLVDRAGQQSAVNGAEFTDGFRGLSQADFRAKLLAETGGEELPIPPDFPQPAKP